MKVGCAGWSSFNAKEMFGNAWKERFGSKLRAYAQFFPVVEVNSTFYRLPRVKTALRWREEVGEEFEFLMKVNRTITHEKRFKDVEEEVRENLVVARARGASVLLFQTPKSFKESEENRRNVERVFESVEGFEMAWEVRGEWKEETLRDVFSTGVIHAVDPFRERPLTEVSYFRLHGSPPGERMYYYKYTREDLVKIRGWAEEYNAEYVIFNNVWMCEDALEFRRMIG